jgi:hypothetical protein
VQVSCETSCARGESWARTCDSDSRGNVEISASQMRSCDRGARGYKTVSWRKVSSFQKWTVGSINCSGAWVQPEHLNLWRDPFRRWLRVVYIDSIAELRSQKKHACFRNSGGCGCAEAEVVMPSSTLRFAAPELWLIGLLIRESLPASL